MKHYFKTRLAAINWIAKFAKHEGQFEVMREQLNFNFIYTGTYFIQSTKGSLEVVMLQNN